jgi:hypothetical protein
MGEKRNAYRLLMGKPEGKRPLGGFFFKFPNLFVICIHTLNTISKLCVEKRGPVEECSLAPLLDKRVKTLCGWLSGKESTN